LEMKGGCRASARLPRKDSLERTLSRVTRHIRGSRDSLVPDYGLSRFMVSPPGFRFSLFCDVIPALHLFLLFHTPLFPFDACK